MPRTELRKRGGVRRVRTIRIGKDRYAHVYVVKKRGKRGGTTVLGEVKRKGRG
jgi:hypothetical protein